MSEWWSENWPAPVGLSFGLCLSLAVSAVREYGVKRVARETCKFAYEFARAVCAGVGAAEIVDRLLILTFGRYWSDWALYWLGVWLNDVASG